MTAKRKVDMPATMPSPDTGEPMARATRPFTVSYKGQSLTVDLPGYYPEGEGESVHVGDDMAVVDAALRSLKEIVDGVPTPATIRRVRKKLQLTQREAGTLLKVGEKAFDKYERGLNEPSGPTILLLRILEKHPAIVAELRSTRAG